MQNKKILLIITGGIASYKSLDLIRRLREQNYDVNCVLTKGGAEFITSLAVSSLSGKQTYTELFSLKDEVEMGHIRLSREADLILVAPTSADFIAKMVHGRADGLAEAALLASNKPIAIAPAMNTQMWNNAATQDNLKILCERGVYQIDPGTGDLACGEIGAGRMAEVSDIVQWCQNYFDNARRLLGMKILITAGATREAIDPIRFISNRSSGKQGYAIAQACIMAGADVTLISGPTDLPRPVNCEFIAVESAQEMYDACEAALPANVAVCTAAVGDWQAASPQNQKIKKQPGQNTLDLSLVQTPDILQMIGHAANRRPQLVIGFAAETGDLIENARAKLKSKKCDWVLANDVGKNPSIMGGDENEIAFVTNVGQEFWALTGKNDIAQKLVEKIASQNLSHKKTA